MKIVKKHITITDTVENMLSEIADKKGLLNISEAIRYCASETHAQVFKDYIVNRKPIRDNFTPEEQVQRKEQIAKIKKTNEENEQLKIVEALGGRVFVSGTSKMCEYKTYSKTASYTQKLPLSHLSWELVDAQFFPNREEVEKHQKIVKLS